MGLLLGIVALAIGFMVVWKANWIYTEFGGVDWADQHLGYEGGSRLFYKLIGMVIIFFGLLSVTGLMDSFLASTIGTLFSQPPV